jgi:intein/homing endonuclease
MDPIQRLREIRNKSDIKIKSSHHMREEVSTGRYLSDGTPITRKFELRNYQKQMVLNLLAMDRFVVGDDMGLGKCVRKDTLIPTNRGLVPIESMAPTTEQEADTFSPVIGWEVSTPNGFRLVKNYYYGGVKPTVKIRTRYGFELEGSRVHPILVSRPGGEGWVKLPDVEVGDFACIDRSACGFPTCEPSLPEMDTSELGDSARIHSIPDVMSPELARLLGYVVAEGSNSNPYCVPITQYPDKNPEVYADIVDLCERFWPGVARTTGEGVAIHSKGIRNWLTQIGVSPTVSHGQVVPWCILTSTRDSVVAFLKAFMDAEGSIGDGIEVSSASETLLMQVQVLLLRLGIVSKRCIKRVKGRDHAYWRLTVFGDDAREYQSQIGLVSTRKQNSLAQVLDRRSNPNHDVIPHVTPIVEAIRASISARVQDISTRWGVSFYNTLTNIRFGRSGMTTQFARRLLEVAAEVGVEIPEVRALAQRVDTRFFYDPVVEISESESEVVDVEVDDDSHAFIGNGFVNHNTVETIAALGYLWDRGESLRTLVWTKKSSVPQWEDEIERFALGVKTFVVKGTPAKRRGVFEKFASYPADKPAVLIQGYMSACQDFDSYQELLGIIDAPTLVLDEATVFKTPTTRVHKICEHISSRSKRTWALTGTLIKNALMEGYGIYKVVKPELFPMSPTNFMYQFSIVKMQKVPGGRQVPVVVGYRGDDIRRFKEIIEPYYLGRPKHAVATELPSVVSQDIVVDMHPNQALKYKEALTGILETGSGEEKEVTKLTAIMYCQEIANHLGLIGFPDEPSSKMDALMDLLTEGDMSEEKVIVFTRFKKLVDMAMPLMQKAKIGAVRVTGDETEDQRRAAMKAFQDPKSKTRVIWITMAGGDAINLQAAKAIVFYDSPWSAGDYLQILGRMVRIGSEHDKVFAYHLMARGSVDQRVQNVLAKKMGLVEAIIGQRLKSNATSDDSMIFDTSSEIKEIFDGLVEDARAR